MNEQKQATEKNQSIDKNYWIDVKASIFFINDKAPGKPDFTGLVSKEGNEIASMIIYENKKDMGILAGYIVLTGGNSLRFAIYQQRNESDNPAAPQFKGKIIVDQFTYQWAMWSRISKKGGNYYAGKIGRPFVDQ